MAKINLQARNCEVDEEMQQHFEDKVQSLENHWSGEVEAHVRIWLHRGRYAAEITLLSGGLIMRGEERADNVRQAFDNAISKLDGQLRRWKEKSQGRARRHDNRDDVAGTIGKQALTGAGLSPDGVSTNDGSSTRFNGSNQDEADDLEDDGVVRVKRFALKPMSAEEASLQMGLLGHSFFVFRDAQSDQVSVVYRRRNGGFGLIEPVSD